VSLLTLLHKMVSTTTLFLTFAAVANASPGNLEAAGKVGDILRANVNNPAFRDAYIASASKMPAVTNPAVASVIAAANAKADKMSSFLQAPRGKLNLFVEEGAGSMADRLFEQEDRQQRHQLTQFQSDEASFKEMLANALSRRSASFVQAPTGAEVAAQVTADVQREKTSMQQLSASIKNYANGVDAGGYTAYHALSSLLSLAGEPNGRTALHLYTPLLSKLKTLMGRESTPDQVRILAGSVITLITNMPVSSQIADAKSGSYGHVNIVLPRPSRVYSPDVDTLALRDGARPIDTLAGGYYGI
jgi:hypothetical protein